MFKTFWKINNYLLKSDGLELWTSLATFWFSKLRAKLYRVCINFLPDSRFAIIKKSPYSFSAVYSSSFITLSTLETGRTSSFSLSHL